MDEETREYIEDGKLIMIDDRMGTKEALNCLEDFEEEETEKCVWCGDYFPIDELHKEKDMGYICNHCKQGLESRGEELEFEDEYDESLNESEYLEKKVDTYRGFDILSLTIDEVEIGDKNYPGFTKYLVAYNGKYFPDAVYGDRDMTTVEQAKEVIDNIISQNPNKRYDKDECLHEEKKDDKIKIKIEVIVSNDLDEKIVSGNPEDKYDEQTLEDWYDFASNVEGLIDQKFFVNNISLSKQPESLSEYIDFYRKDEDGNRKEGIVDLRLSDHGATTNARRNRINKIKKIDPNYKLVSVIVNERQFDSYDEALEYVKKLLNDLNK